MGSHHRRRYCSWFRNHFLLLNVALPTFAFALFLLNENVFKKLTSNLFIHGYFNDALSMWLYLPYINLLLSLYPHRQLRITSLPACITVTLISGLGWEYLTPLYRTGSVSDPLDLVMYTIGGITYSLFAQRIKKSRTQESS
ncbi:hypothetical protein CIG75_14260 [Tumebacillus algifaecis]|uniref:VanZ-like domain-containing protein n=1 Tax=Tumebacillus algifaecis TaxID=1214604 RepID=A0A223D338_9BACL|nr:hypothetical protein [Tumebacillus algifaecis]ASS76012.1 hypothetical protein CIG75_14260 [Tumebacillus algifaecis]